jgi:hypothetical protein
MRKIATVQNADAEFRRLMIYDAGASGVFLFLFRSLADGPCDADYWYEDVESAELHAAEYGVERSDWQEVSGPAPGSMDDRFSGPI